MSTDQGYASRPGPGQGILSLTERGWPVHDRPQDEQARAGEALERAARALFSAHVALAPYVGRGPGQVSHPWAFGLELALNQAANLVPADRHQSLFNTPAEVGGFADTAVAVNEVPIDRVAVHQVPTGRPAAIVLDVEHFVREAEQALREFPIWQHPPETAELIGMVSNLLVDVSSDSMNGSRGRPR